MPARSVGVPAFSARPVTTPRDEAHRASHTRNSTVPLSPGSCRTAEFLQHLGRFRAGRRSLAWSYVVWGSWLQPFGIALATHEMGLVGRDRSPSGTMEEERVEHHATSSRYPSVEAAGGLPRCRSGAIYAPSSAQGFGPVRCNPATHHEHPPRLMVAALMPERVAGKCRRRPVSRPAIAGSGCPRPESRHTIRGQASPCLRPPTISQV